MGDRKPPPPALQGLSNPMVQQAESMTLPTCDSQTPLDSVTRKGPELGILPCTQSCHLQGSLPN